MLDIYSCESMFCRLKYFILNKFCRVIQEVADTFLCLGVSLLIYRPVTTALESCYSASTFRPDRCSLYVLMANISPMSGNLTSVFMQ
jgi:hypothetical protein